MNPASSANADHHFIVLGAGIVGASCALALRQEGFAVTLVDRDAPGQGASFGNAGYIQTGTPMPLAAPGVLKQLPKLLTDPESPLSIRWRHLPRLMPFLTRMLAASRPSKVEEISLGLQALLDKSGEAHRAMMREAGATDLMRTRGLLFVYPSEATYREADWEIDLYRRRGAKIEALQDGELRQMEPALARDYRWGYYMPECFYTVDPGALTEHYAARFAALGGTVVRDDVHDIEMGSNGPKALLCASGRRPLDSLVLAAGAFSKRFAKRLGANLPLETARGYHLMLPQPGVELQGPVLDGAMHFGVTPMSEGIRLAGTLEFASLDAEPNYDRADMLLPMAQAMLPDLKADQKVQWMGHRPAMPDTLPVIGRAPRYDNAYFAFGHGMLGLTMGAVTGQLVAALAAGRTPEVDLTPYRPDRF